MLSFFIRWKLKHRIWILHFLFKFSFLTLCILSLKKSISEQELTDFTFSFTVISNLYSFTCMTSNLVKPQRRETVFKARLLVYLEQKNLKEHSTHSKRNIYDLLIYLRGLIPYYFAWCLIIMSPNLM